MKILYIHTADYLHHPNPSRQHAIFEILAERHEVHVLHFHVSRGITRETKCIIDEATLYNIKNPFLHYIANAPYQYQVIKKLILEKGIDVIVTTNILASTAAIKAARKYDVPVIFDLSDWLPTSASAYTHNKFFKKIVEWSVLKITGWNLKHSNTIVTVSPSLKKRIQDIYGLQSIVITNGVDTDLFKPMDKEVAKTIMGLEGKFVIGFEGALERWYALDDMIKAMPELLQSNPDIRLVIIGESIFTGYKEELQILAEALGVEKEVIFKGSKPYRQLPGYIAAFDVGTIPLKDKEWAAIALPNKFFEYAACGKPILMCPVPDIMEMGRELWIYRTQDEYVRTVKRMIGMNIVNHRGAQEHSWKNKAEQFECLIGEVRVRT